VPPAADRASRGGEGGALLETFGAGSETAGVTTSAGAGAGATGVGAGGAAGRLIGPPDVLLLGRVSAGWIAGETAGAGSKTGGSSSTVYSRTLRPSGHVASTSNVTNGSAIDSREVIWTVLRPLRPVTTRNSRLLRNAGRSRPCRANVSALANPILSPSSSSVVADNAISARNG
jgi:hypothetical protein